MAKKKKDTSGALIPAESDIEPLDETVLFERVAAIIENRKYRAYAHANHENTLMFWEVGQYINSVVLGNKRAAYGKQILTTLSAKLVAKYGKSFVEKNIYRMTLFAERFSDLEILPLLAAKLSWSHFIELLSLKSDEARLFYANDAVTRNYGTKELRRQISRKAYERREIANTELSEQSTVPFNVFKDPYLLDVFGLKENYLEADLEKAILADIEAFILEFGHGFSFVERQKRMILDGEDIVLDLLFYHRILKRLIAIELKLGKFQAEHKGQMELYLKWLDRYERQPGEEAPIGIILCATANREKIELLEMDKAGIAVAEYWTHLPPKAEFEEKIKSIMIEAKERLERRKSFFNSEIQKEIDYFIEPKDDDEE
ncbi:MAG: PDDEXK nuclease domain-containing protein [Oscillospiraceae bacterium]|nr:PDDEXK nuclease domain-containing protein [Oscillospiraceae bacterium]